MRKLRDERVTAWSRAYSEGDVNPGLTPESKFLPVEEPLLTFLLNINAWFRTHCCSGYCQRWPDLHIEGGELVRGWPASGPEEGIGGDWAQRAHLREWGLAGPAPALSQEDKGGDFSITYVVGRCSHARRCSLRNVAIPVRLVLSLLRGCVFS